jgi:predicted HicB family RNase H-like nuclease
VKRVLLSKGGIGMNTMTYKGYLGSVAYSDKDQVFFGKIEGIKGLVNFEGESVKELTAAFHEAVDDYLAYCEDEGIEPDKSYTGVLNVRLTPAIHRQIAMLAIKAGISINAYIKDALEEKVESSAAM